MSYSCYERVLVHASNLDTAEPVPEAEIEFYRGILPDGLLEVWTRHGNAIVFGDGRVQLCNPAVFQPAIARMFRGDPEFDPLDFIVYAYSSTGTILLTDGMFDHMNIDLSSSIVTVSQCNPPPSGETGLDYELAHSLDVYGGTYHLHEKEEDDQHDEAVEVYGPIGTGEIFAWDPPFQIQSDFSNRLKKADALEHIQYIQELEPLVYEASSMEQVIANNYLVPIRTIGPQT